MEWTKRMWQTGDGEGERMGMSEMRRERDGGMDCLLYCVLDVQCGILFTVYNKLHITMA